MKPNFGKKLHKNDRLYGTSTVGARGQVVIPADARKDFKLASGDQLIILGNRLTKTMVIMKSSNLGEFVKIVLEQMSGSGLEQDIQKHFKNLFGKLSQAKAPQQKAKK